MANRRAIAAIGATLVGLLSDRWRQEGNTSVPVQLYQPKDFETPMALGFSVFLYRVTVNGSVRNRAHRISPDGHRFLPSLPLDLHYMVTPWAGDAQSQQLNLGWVMRVLEDFGQLSASHLNHYLDDDAGGKGIFSQDEALDIICDPLSLTDYLSMWERLKALPISATYTARMVLIDSTIQTAKGEPVRTRRFEMGEVGP